jgi:serine/threonine-protein kinase RsbW
MSGVDTAYARRVVGSVLWGVNSRWSTAAAALFSPDAVPGRGVLEVRKAPVTPPLPPSREQGRNGKALPKASLELRNEAAALPRLIDFVEDFARRHDLPQLERSRLLLVLEELFTNVVKYGRGADAVAKTIGVALAVKGGKLTIEFSDDGPPFDPLIAASPDLERPIADRPIGGLGLHILRSLVEHARYRRKGDRNHLVLKRSIASPD